jgi:LCP family protein required for cell wall assembly
VPSTEEPESPVPIESSGADSSGSPRTPRSVRWGRILRNTAIVLAGVVAIASVGGYALYRHFNGQITRINIRLPTTAAAPSPTSSSAPDLAAGKAKSATTTVTTASSDGAENFLLMGSDSRDFVGGQSYNVAPGSSAYVTGERSDVVMLLHIPAGNAKATVVSFPRDSWVQIPQYTDSKGVNHPAVEAKLNAAFDLGGAPLLVTTMEDLTGLHIDHFASINFPGFQGMVNALGGVNVCIGTTRHDTNSGDFLTAGDHHLNGAQALALVRDRESFADQDLGRIKDQEYFLSVMLHQVLSANTLTNPIKLTEFLNTATKSLTVDSGLSLGDMRKLASRFAHLSTANVGFETAPVEDANYHVTSSVYGGQIQSAVELDAARSAALFASLGVPAASGSPASSAPTLPVSQVQVTVENGTSVANLAHDVAGQLSAAGFTITAIQDAPAGSYPRSVIDYGPAAVAAANTLLAHEPEATLQADSATGSGVVLILGSNAVSSSGSAASSAPVATPTPIPASSLSCAP